MHKAKSSLTRDVDNIYYNIIIPHDDRAGARETPVRFEETRTEPIVGKASDYYLAVERFNVPGFNIPIFIFKIRPDNAADPQAQLRGIYSVTLEYAGDVQQVYLLFSSRASGGGAAPAYTTPQTRSSFYFVYEYQHMVDMMNTALATAFAALAAPPVGSVAPWFEYDATTQLISLVAQRAFYDQALVTPINVYVNSFLFPFIQGIAADFLGFNDPLGQDYQILVGDQFDNWYNPSFVVPATPPDYFRMEQDFNTLNNWTDFKNLVFRTSTVPVNYEEVPPAGNLAVKSQGTPDFRPILTDFSPLLERAGDFRSTLQFFPQGPLRLIDLNSDSPLSRFDLQAFWEDELGNLYPVQISPSQVFSMKIVFIRKTLFKGDRFLLE